jgi:hypothetical protein
MKCQRCGWKEGTYTPREAIAKAMELASVAFEYQPIKNEGFCVIQANGKRVDAIVDGRTVASVEIGVPKPDTDTDTDTGSTLLDNECQVCGTIHTVEKCPKGCDNTEEGGGSDG